MNKLPVYAVLTLLGGFALFALVQPGLVAGQKPEVVQALLTTLPLSFGAWKGVELERTDKDDRDMRVAGAVASISRRYRDEKGNDVNLLVLYGKPSDMGAHSPQVCYKAIGFKQCANQAQKKFPGEEDALWFIRFENERQGRETLAVYWGWGTGGKFQAVDNPRTAFSDQAAIYKVYIQRSTNEPRTADEDAVLKDFTTAFLRELNSKLSPLSDSGRHDL